MAVVDFTLDDVRKVVLQDVTKVIDDRFQLFETKIDNRFHVFEDKYDDDMSAIQDDLVTIISRLDAIEPRLAGTRRIVDKHSKDIMELRAIVQG